MSSPRYSRGVRRSPFPSSSQRKKRALSRDIPPAAQTSGEALSRVIVVKRMDYVDLADMIRSTITQIRQVYVNVIEKVAVRSWKL